MEREISSTRREGTFVMSLSQQGVTLGNTTFFFIKFQSDDDGCSRFSLPVSHSTSSCRSPQVRLWKSESDSHLEFGQALLFRGLSEIWLRNNCIHCFKQANGSNFYPDVLDWSKKGRNFYAFGRVSSGSNAYAKPGCN